MAEVINIFTKLRHISWDPQALQILLSDSLRACVKSRSLLWQRKGGAQAQGMGNEWAEG